MTKSEIKTEIKSKRVFLPEFVQYSIKYKGIKGEDELCDCLLEFQNTYFAIEVKERNENCKGKNSGNWYKNKIEKNAVDRIVKFYRLYKQSDKLSFYDENGNTVTIDSKNETIPIIVFDNPEIKEYKRIVYCSRINRYINVFSMEDFNEAFDTLLIPYEIRQYLLFRESLLCKNDVDLKSHLIIGDYGDKTILWGGGINSEAELAQYYYGIRSNVDEPNEIERRLLLFNHISNHIRDSIDLGCNDTTLKKDIISFVNSVDINLAYEFSKAWEKCLERSKETNGCYIPRLFHLDDKGLLLMNKPGSYSEKEFSDLCEVLILLYAYKRHFSFVYLIGFYKIDDDVGTVFMCKRYDSDFFEYPDKELEDMIKKYNETGFNI